MGTHWMGNTKENNWLIEQSLEPAREFAKDNNSPPELMQARSILVVTVWETIFHQTKQSFDF